jgi:RNA polymerase-binding transcription factor DksA
MFRNSIRKDEKNLLYALVTLSDFFRIRSGIPEYVMSNSILLRMKESLASRREAIALWMQDVSASKLAMRLGPLDEQALSEQLHTLDEAVTKAESDTLGLCTVCQGEIEPGRLEMDYTASVCLEHLSDEERSRLENELELSQKVQQALLPHVVPEIRGVEAAVFSQPAHIVGGDYFDFLRFKTGSHAIIIADVMGKGMPASLLMASLQASLRIIVPETDEPADALTRLNHIFCHNIRLTKFVTIFIARYEETTCELTFSNAGHNPPFLVRTGGSIESLRPTGAAIGLAEQSVFRQRSVHLSNGDRLLLYTDGVVESMNTEGQEFGDNRLHDCLLDNTGSTPQRLVTTLRDRLKTFRGADSPIDDTTIMAIHKVA